MITAENGDKVLSRWSITLPACLHAGRLQVHTSGFSSLRFVVYSYLRDDHSMRAFFSCSWWDQEKQWRWCGRHVISYMKRFYCTNDKHKTKTNSTVLLWGKRAVSFQSTMTDSYLGAVFTEDADSAVGMLLGHGFVLKQGLFIGIFNCTLWSTVASHH